MKRMLNWIWWCSLSGETTCVLVLLSLGAIPTPCTELLIVRKHLLPLESVLFLNNSRCEKCIGFNLKKSFLQTSCEFKGFVLRQCVDGVLLLRVWAPSESFWLSLLWHWQIGWPKVSRQVFNVSVGTKLPTVSRAGLVDSDDIPWFY